MATLKENSKLFYRDITGKNGIFGIFCAIVGIISWLFITIIMLVIVNLKAQVAKLKIEKADYRRRIFSLCGSIRDIRRQPIWTNITPKTTFTLPTQR